MRKPPYPPVLPHTVWINPPKKESASQDGAGATLSIADVRLVALKVAALEAVSESCGRLIARDYNLDSRDDTQNANGKCPTLIDTIRVAVFKDTELCV